MKNLILSICIAIISIATAHSQNMGKPGNGTKSMKEFIKRELGTDTVKANTAFAIYDAYHTAIVQNMTAPNLNQQERTTNANKAQAEKVEKLKAVLTEEQIAKFDAHFVNLRRNKVIW